MAARPADCGSSASTNPPTRRMARGSWVWPRGISKERAAVDLWLKEIAPSPALRKWFGHDPQRWSEFRSRYRAELDRNTAAVGRLLDLAMQGEVTLLYAAHDAAHNHAVVLIEYMDELSRR
jgi:uncharacterized protein YeaO (DUF488 family)